MADGTDDPLSRIRSLLDRHEGELAAAGFGSDLAALRDRLDGPLRVALAGRVKAGKSTLLNALIGERLAPTDARECTKIVTWYEYGPQYEVIAELGDGTVTELPFRRREGTLEVDLGSLTERDVERLRVRWPIARLQTMVLIDTPGLGSLRDDNSARTRRFLDSSDETSDVDAVVYLMRHVHRSDLEFLDAFMDRTVAARSAVNAIAVLSRADEIGAGRLDAMESARRIAARYATHSDVRAFCSTVVPVAGLLAETASTFRESEMNVLRRLAAAPPAAIDEMLLSVESFCAPHLSEVSVEERRDLLDRLGLFGVRLAVTEVGADPAITSARLADLLLGAAGLEPLRELLRASFEDRASVMKAASALSVLWSLAIRLANTAPDLAARLDRDIERIQASAVDFARIRAHALVGSGAVDFPDDRRDELDRLLVLADDAEALGLPSGSAASTVAARALEMVEQWRTAANDPTLSSDTVDVTEAAVRVCERIYARAAAQPDMTGAP